VGRPSVKEQLVDRTRDLLMARGFEGASVGALVTEAGVPKGSFYNHFPSKELFAVEHVHRYMQTLDLAELGSDSGSALEAVRRHFDQQVAARQNGTLPPSCLLGTLSTTVTADYPVLLEAIRRGFDAWIGALGAALDRAKKAGEIGPGSDPEKIAGALVDSFEGAVARARATQQWDPLTNFVAVTFPALVHA
jgi:TetR/AcrR family transcriptional regulator, transcriptional repressor for nem operon